MPNTRLTLRRLALAMPFVFLVHMAEDSSGLVEWFNARVEPDVTMRLFLVANGASFLITTVIAIQLAIVRERVAAVIALAWIGFAMLANAVYHIIAAFADRAWVPGLATSLLLYLPFSIALIGASAVERRITRATAVSVMLAGGIPMYVHGWLVVFEGTRLF
ncbi:MAG: HXXEE domain-containing protein [Steroidobacteraceae bacterium]